MKVLILLLSLLLNSLQAVATIATGDDNNDKSHHHPEQTKPIRIALYNGEGTFTGSLDFLVSYYDTIRTASTHLSQTLGMGPVSIVNVTESTITEMLTNDDFDVVLFPGGTGNGIAAALGEEGMDTVKSFVHNGGGYIGTCAGGFLAIKHLYLYGPNVPTEEPWNRGDALLPVEFTSTGVGMLGLDPKVYGTGIANEKKNVTINYRQGPIVAENVLPPTVNRIAYFREEVHSRHTDETKGKMINTAAISSAVYGKGRVVVNSPHPELEPIHPDVYEGELAWVTGLMLPSPQNRLRGQQYMVPK